ncbi:MAG: Large cysteine-rich periplasmic protein OmcB, partial [Bacteroidota bacterium]
MVKFLRSSQFLLVLCALFAATNSSAQLTLRYSNNIKGDLIFVANNNISCGTGSGNCTKTNNTPLYTGPDNATLNNNTGNNYTSASLTYFNDIDADATTFNSTSSNYVLPSGTQCPEVVWAGLYWGAEASVGTISNVPAQYATSLTFANRTKCKFKVPGASSYTDITATATFSDGNFTYHCFRDVTNIVKAAGPGTYTCANIVGLTSGSQKDGGWTLVIIYSDQNAPKRNLSVFDGMVSVASTNANVNVNISGFSTPPFGPISARCGLIVYDGDRSSVSDSLQFRGQNGTNFPNFVKLSDASHPVNNAFNSSIANYGVNVTTRNPIDNNTLGYDASLFNIPNVGNVNLGNSATSATLKLTTGNEAYRVGTVVTMIDVVDPEIDLRKKVTDVNGGSFLPGDIIEYEIIVRNKGNDTAINSICYDSIPFNTVYVPGTMKINGVAKTDAAGDDQANFDGTRVNFRVGFGATATTGGKMKINEAD